MKKTCVEKDSKVTSETRKNKNQHNLCSTLTRHGLLLVARERLYNTNRKNKHHKTQTHAPRLALNVIKRERILCLCSRSVSGHEWKSDRCNPFLSTDCNEIGTFSCYQIVQSTQKGEKNTRFNEISSNNNIVY